MKNCPSLQNQVIYTVFLRAHTEEGSFRALIPDLDRIRALGVDIVCLMPIYLAAPEYGAETMPYSYSVLDHRQVSVEYGSMEDFRELLDKIHRRGMKCEPERRRLSGSSHGYFKNSYSNSAGTISAL